MSENRYRVQVRDGKGWEAVILDPSGAEVFRRACGSEREARSFASTVEQHIGWLSERKFREYYRIA
jgi:hypothetical protein